MLSESKRRSQEFVKGSLLAPRRQLDAAGIAANYVSPSIKDLEQHAGLIDVKRGIGRRRAITL